jgi:uncharacterized membrane protein
MQGKATFGGHPIHPILIPYPIAFFTGSLICYIIDYFVRDSFWPQMATWLVAFGVVGALMAALFGFIDYFTIPMAPATHKVATNHMIVNLLAVLVFVVAFFVLWGNNVATLGIGLVIVGNVLLAISGYLGGEMVFRGHVGVQD